MPELASYPGSPSLSAEAREKVVQTFRHTLEMARAGRNEDALLGCDFILKMDARFTPARRLLASLRGVAAGTVVDLAEFDVFGAAPAPAPAAPRRPGTAPSTPAAGYGVPAAPPSAQGAPATAPSGLDALAFDDLGANPFAPPSAAAPAPSFAASPDFGFGAPPRDAFGTPASDLSFSPAPPAGDDAGAAASFASPSTSPDPFAAAAPSPSAAPPPAPIGTTDPRIVQFLKQGDEAAARGHLQEAIDLWSRVFLIDLSNEDASQRIDAAREKQSDAARRLDVLLSEGVQLYEAGDLHAARDAFLKVLAVSETDATARNYMNQIDSALAGGAAAAAPTAAHAAPAPVEPYLRDELESPGRPSFAEDIPLEAEPVAAGRGEEGAALRGARDVEAPGRGGKVDARVLLGVGVLVLLGVAGGAWFLFKPKAEAPPPAAAPARVPATAAQNPLERAQALFKEGKVEEALGILTAIPAGDPRHDQALVLIDQFKSSAEPRPSAAPAVSEAQVDEARVAGLASLAAGRYIEAVKSLDLVAKARPDDAEASRALARARDAVSALGAAIRSYNEQDYESAQRLLWDLRKQDPKNQDVEEYLFKSYFNDGVMALQSGSMKKAADSFKEAVTLRPQDAEAQHHLKFARKYAGGSDDLLARIYVRHVSPRP